MTFKLALTISYVLCACLVHAGAIDMPPGDAEWLTDDRARGGLQGWWNRSNAPGGSYVVPAVLLTGVALTGVAAFVLLRRRRLL